MASAPIRDQLGDPVIDTIAGTSIEAHRAGLERVVHAGGAPTSWVSFACELASTP